MNRIPVWAIVLAAIVAVGLLAFFIMRQVKGEDTQGVEYGGGKDAYKQRMAEKMKGAASSGYGKARPAAPASATQTGRGGYGGPGGGGYGGR